MTKKKKMTSILVGCGGSGAKIATELANLMSQDPQWRYDMDENVFFMLVDTDQGDLNSYSDRLKASAPNVHVSSILSTAGFNTVEEILADFIPGLGKGDEDEQREAMSRFAEHWWFKNPSATSWENSEPFRARSVAQIKTGAGQVPLVSHLAAWYAMRDGKRITKSIESTLLELCETIAARRAIINHGDDDPLSTFNVFFLGSVAGGTGRGCIIPVAFKFKEVFFNRFNSVPHISGYFLDESCFKSGRDRHEELPQKLNAMTGWSELSSWLGLFHSTETVESKDRNYGYSLPSMREPGDSSYDVLRSARQGRLGADRISKDQDASRRAKARVPVDHVGVIGNTSSSGFEIKNPNIIYQMVATGLYCRLIRSEIEGKISNDGRTYFSIGSAIAQIPCHEIQEYYRDLARHDAAEQIKREPSGPEVFTEAESIIDWLDLSDPLPALLGDPDEGEAENSMERLVKSLFSKQRGEGALQLNQVNTALDDQNVGDVSVALDEVLKEGQLDDPGFVSRIGDAFVKQFLSDKGIEGTDNIETIAEAVIERLIGTDEESVLTKTGSVTVVSAVVKRLEKKMAELAESTFSAKAIEDWFSNPEAQFRQPNVHEVLERIKGKEGPLGLTGKYFSDQEISEMMTEARRALQVIYARALGKWLTSTGSGKADMGLMKCLMPKLNQIKTNASMVGKCADRCLSESTLTRKQLRERADKLFSTDELVHSLAMSDPNSTDYYVRRNIRPPQPLQEELKLVNSKALDTARAALMGDRLDGESADDYPTLRNDLRDDFNTSRYLLKTQSEGEEIIQAFELAPVLRDLAKRWRPYLKKENDRSRDEFEETAQKFYNFFGIRPKVVGNEVSLSGDGKLESIGGEDALLLGMASAMARSCRPFWKTADTASTEPRLTVQIPIEPAAEKISEWGNEIQGQANIQGGSGKAVEVIANRQNSYAGGQHNPFVLIVYMSEGASSLDRLESLNSWELDSTIQRALRRAEDLKKPPMPFATADEMWDGYRGSGFADPCYIFNSTLRKHRWRPWVSLEDQEQEAVDIEGLDLAVMYACLGPEWFLTKALGEAECARVLAETELPSGPIFKEGERQIFHYDRAPYVIARRGEASVNTAQFVFTSGDAIAQSIRTIPDMLNGIKPPRSKDKNSQVHIPKLREAVEMEYTGFFEYVAEEHGFHPKSGKSVYARLVKAMQTRALEERHKNQKDSPFWQTVLETLKAKKKLYDL